MAKQELRAVSVITIGGVTYIWDDLPEETKTELRQRMLDRAGRALSRYLSGKPDEAKKLLQSYGRE